MGLIENAGKALVKPGRKGGRPCTGGADPVLPTRAPRELIAAVKSRAAEREIAVSVVIREALERYLREPFDQTHQDRAA
jgi:hypothetical protein